MIIAINFPIVPRIVFRDTIALLVDTNLLAASATSSKTVRRVFDLGDKGSVVVPVSAVADFKQILSPAFAFGCETHVEAVLLFNALFLVDRFLFLVVLALLLPRELLEVGDFLPASISFSFSVLRGIFHC